MDTRDKALVGVLAFFGCLAFFSFIYSGYQVIYASEVAAIFDVSDTDSK
jgi:hypothetical protein